MRQPAILGLALSSICTLVGCASGGGRSGSEAPAVRTDYDEAAVARASATITDAELRGHIAFLASDELGGRDTPSPGLEKAAAYIGDRFASYGLPPAGDEGTFIQRWPFQRARLRNEAVELIVREPGGLSSLDYGREFFVLPSKQEQVEGEAVYFGSVEHVVQSFPPAAAGKIALVTPPSSWEGVDVMGAFAAAAEAGALAFVLVFPPGVPEQVMAANVEESRLNQPESIFWVGMLYQAAEALFKAAGLDLDGLLWEVTPDRPRALSGVAMAISAPLERIPSEPPNVAALLRGSDPELSETYLVYTAHFDALGFGAPDASGDSIYNGANDNASGSAALIEIAKAFASMPTSPARSVVFLAVSGEERGFQGSRHWVRDPTVPGDRVIANLNIDVIAGGADTVPFGLSEEYIRLGPLSRQIVVGHPELRLTETTDRSFLAPIGAGGSATEADLFRSDHGPFALAGIPFFMFGGGLSEELHTPSDEIDRLDIGRAARVARLYFVLGAAIAADPIPPAWNEGSLEHIREIVPAVLGEGQE
jgi:hypothetical protein